MIKIRNNKYIVGLFLQTVILILLTFILCFCFNFKSAAVSYVGSCGKNVEWYLDTNTETLEIIGEGKIDSFDNFQDYPWHEHSDNIKSVNISDGIASISPGMFYRLENLMKVSIPRSVTEIENYAFYGCKNLKVVEFQENSKLNIIGEYAFAYCRNLHQIEIPTRVAEIKKNSFLYCYKLPDITLGYSVKTIGENAFSCCSFLKRIRIVNYNCEIYDNANTIYSLTEIESFQKSTAANFAEQYLRSFSKISNIKFLNDMEISLNKTSFFYSGKQIKPKVTIAGLKENIDFTVDYINNISPGIATAVVSAAGNVLGEVSANYEIRPEEVKNLRVGKRKTNELTLIWDKSFGVDNYKIYQYINKKWEKIGETAEKEFTVKKLKPSTEYKFKIKAYKKTSEKNLYSEYCDELKTSTKPETPKISSISNRGRGRLTVKWNVVSGCDGYEVYISKHNDKNFKLAANLTSSRKSSTTVKNLKNSTKYYIKVKAYKLVDDIKVYSSMSDAQSKNTM